MFVLISTFLCILILLHDIISRYKYTIMTYKRTSFPMCHFHSYSCMHVLYIAYLIRQLHINYYPEYLIVNINSLITYSYHNELYMYCILCLCYIVLCIKCLLTNFCQTIYKLMGLLQSLSVYYNLMSIKKTLSSNRTIEFLD